MHDAPPVPKLLEACEMRDLSWTTLCCGGRLERRREACWRVARAASCENRNRSRDRHPVSVP